MEDVLEAGGLKGIIEQAQTGDLPRFKRLIWQVTEGKGGAGRGRTKREF
jgi:hypothetical protein